MWVGLLVVGWAVGSLLGDHGPTWDASTVADLRGRPGAELTATMRAITWLGSSVLLDVVFAVAVVVLLARGAWRELGFLLLASPATVVLVQLTKAIVDRHRPAGPHLTAAGGPSFPSGHTSSSAALYGALLLIWLHAHPHGAPWIKRLAALGLAVVLGLIGFSRIYLGVHYPSDVIAAWVLVAVWLAALERRWLARGQTNYEARAAL